MKAAVDESTFVNDKFNVRDVVLFEPHEGARRTSFMIEAVPEEECLAARIVMHKSIATRLLLRQIFIGDKPRGRAGMGTCEIFLADVPNWTPDNLIITPDKPLRMFVTNMTDMDLKVVGTVIVYKRGG